MCKRKQRVLLVINPQKSFRGNTCALEELTTYVKGVFGWYDLVVVSCFSTSVYNNKNKLYSKKLGDCGLPRIFKAEELGYFLSEISGVVIINSNQRGISLQELVEKDETNDFNGVCVDVIGCNKLNAVLATCYRLWDDQYEFRVFTDKVYDDSGFGNGAIDVKLLLESFGACTSNSACRLEETTPVDDELVGLCV